MSKQVRKKKKQKAEKIPREIRCGSCGKIVKVGRYVSPVDYLCGKCLEVRQKDETNDKRD